jgi:glutamate N-acetyltransferase/amino-acid N-acetyltransferase
MSVTAASGFVAAGIACGVKESGDLDLSLVATADGRPVNAAGVFTANLMTAAPVLTTRRHLEQTSGRAAAVVLNSGNANAATGEAGLADAQAMCQAVGSALGCDPHEVLVCSTGLIGIPLPIDKIVAGAPELVAHRSAAGGIDAAEAIRTTDTFRKEALVETTANDDATMFTVGGMAKGAAMLAPNMATMLAVLTTDAAAEPAALKAALQRGVATSFNVMSVDGCQSTNDTVLLLASGAAGPVDQVLLDDSVARVCKMLAEAMVLDAEGATKSVWIEVTGAASDADAATGARKVADSNLCKCSWYGQDPYWGRIASELGSAGIAFDQTAIAISYGDATVAAGGIEIDHDRASVTEHMAGRSLHISADLGQGDGTASVFTNDLTHAYIDENMGTS